MPTAVAPVTPVVPIASSHLLAIDVPGLLAGRIGWHEVAPVIGAWVLTTGGTVLLVILLTLVALKAYTGFVGRVFALINKNLRPDAIVRVTQRSQTLSGILTSLGKVLILGLGATLILSLLGLNIAPIVASAGIVGLAVGFGAQSLVKDVISGFFILTEDQYGVGDVIQVGESTGLVEKMNLRITQLRNQHGQLITIPNGGITTVINHSKEWARAVIEVGVSYNEDPDRVSELLLAIGAELLGEMPEKIMEPVEVLGVEAFKESEVVIKLMIKTRPLEQWTVARAFRRKLWLRFKEHGIEIPFPQRTLWLASAGDSKAGGGSVQAVAEALAPSRPTP